MLYGNIFCVYPVHIPNYSFNVADKSVRNFDVVSYYNRRNSNVSPVFVCGGRPRTAHIYNPPKPSFDKEGLWQGSALHCFAIVIVASKSCKKWLEISIWSPTIEENRKDFLFFYGCGGRTDVLSRTYNSNTVLYTTSHP